MFQGIFSAFLIRIPVAFFMSRTEDATLFKIGLATPCSSAVQIVLCLLYFFYLLRLEKKNRLFSEPQN